MEPETVDWSRTGLEQVRRAGKGFVALGRRLNAAGKWQSVLVLLKGNGSPVAISDPLPVENPTVARNLVVTGRNKALVAVADRTEIRPDPRTVICHDRPRWFLAGWSGKGIRLKELDSWNDVSVGNVIRGTRVEDRNVWAACAYPPDRPREFHMTRLVVAESRGTAVPQPRFIEADCVDLSEPVESGGTCYVLVSSRWEQIELWAIHEGLEARRVLVLEAKRKKGQTLGPPRMAACGDSLLMAWGHYTEKARKDWEGVVHVASYRPADRAVSDVVKAAADTRVIAASLELHPLRDSIAVTWEHRPQRGTSEIRAVRFSSVDQLPCETTALQPNSYKLFIPSEPGPILREFLASDSSWAVRDSVPSL